MDDQASKTQQASKIHPTVRIEAGTRRTIDDPLALESMFTLFVNRIEVATILCSPSLTRELAVGFLLGEGVLQHREDLLSVRYEKSRGIVRIKVSERVDLSPFSGPRKGTITSGCGKGQTYTFVRDVEDMDPLPFGLTIDSKRLGEKVREFSHMSTTYKDTGGVHSSMLWDGKKLGIFAEDLGRHNAVDKVFGASFMQNIPTQGHMLLTSGRMSSEIVLKAARAGVPLIASRNAPTSFSVQLAELLDLTLVGFVRGDRMNVYTHAERVK
jgi:FdhD protein